MKRERIEQIATLVDKRGVITLAQLREFFPKVSEMTLRRDLFLLEEEGKIVRVRGGAKSVKDLQQTSGVPYAKNTNLHVGEKRTIGAKAAALIDEGASVFIDGGTTSLYFAKEMPDVPCTVFTTGIAIAQELSKKKNITIHVLGGILKKENLSTVAAVAPSYFEEINFEHAIISASAFTPESGFSCDSMMEAEQLKLLRSKAKFTYMMLDSSKIGKVMPYTFASIDDISVLITDTKFPASLKELFKEHNIVVM
ncbi:MAG: DeoR/GlpR transcriptional regulator [Clostridia bacterium]|nr:DeoR/GlpR transcriptional regulator [Clostridia bacterium]